jgi:hypothetical protein
VPGTPDAAPYDDDDHPVRGHRDRAMRTIDGLVDADRLPARSAETVEALTRSGSMCEQSWTAHSGSDHRPRGGAHMRQPRSENRQLTEIVSVRFTPSDMDEVRHEASKHGMTVPQLLRERALNRAPAAS